MTKSDDAPILDAYRTPEGQLAVWCAYDQRWHWHGGHDDGKHPSCPRRMFQAPYRDVPCECPPGTGDGHRAAHCHNPSSPYQDGGYVLREVGPLAPDIEHRAGVTRRLVVTRASDVQPVSHGDLTLWGPWRLAADYPALAHPDYEVDLLECRTAGQCLDWIAQVAGKTWADPATVAGLVHALDDLLDLQPNLCPGGRSRQVTAKQIRARATAALQWAPLWESA